MTVAIGVAENPDIPEVLNKNLDVVLSPSTVKLGHSESDMRTGVAAEFDERCIWSFSRWMMKLNRAQIMGINISRLIN